MSEANKDFQVTFWGVRGSRVACSPEYAKYGGNTACVYVKAGDTNIIIDMGTGVAGLSDYFAANNLSSAHILISHFHYDHIEGIRLFTPFFSKGEYTLYARPDGGMTIKQVFESYLSYPFWPVSVTDFPAQINYHNLTMDEAFSPAVGITIATAETNHTGVCTAFRINFNGKSVAYMLDHEHGTSRDTELCSLCKDTELIIYDANYTKEEYDTGKYMGWGHSTVERAVDFAKDCGAKRLAISHHAPWRSDNELNIINESLAPINGFAAREGLVITI